MLGQVVFCTDPAEDYLADYLYEGFCRLGCRVVDYPTKPVLHGGGDGSFACHLNEPLPPAIDWSGVGMVVVPGMREGHREAFSALARMARGLPIVVVDGEDSSAHGVLALANQQIGSGFWFFKRETYDRPHSHDGPCRQFRPEQDGCIIPAPFCYPRSREHAVGDHRAGILAAWHVWSPYGQRTELSKRLMQARIPGVFCRFSWEFYTERSGERLSRQAYDREVRRVAAVVIPAGAGWYTNRLYESVAQGAAPILERPPMGLQWPNALVEGESCRMYSSVDECLDIVAELVTKPDECARLALNAQDNWRKYHTAEARAAQIVATVREAFAWR